MCTGNLRPNAAGLPGPHVRTLTDGLTLLRKSDKKNVFQFPVPSNFRGLKGFYSDVIKNPMDLGTVMKNIDTKYRYSRKLIPDYEAAAVCSAGAGLEIRAWGSCLVVGTIAQLVLQSVMIVRPCPGISATAVSARLSHETTRQGQPSRAHGRRQASQRLIAHSCPKALV